VNPGGTAAGSLHHVKGGAGGSRPRTLVRAVASRRGSGSCPPFGLAGGDTGEKQRFQGRS